MKMSTPKPAVRRTGWSRVPLRKEDDLWRRAEMRAREFYSRLEASEAPEPADAELEDVAQTNATSAELARVARAIAELNAKIAPQTGTASLQPVEEQQVEGRHAASGQSDAPIRRVLRRAESATVSIADLDRLKASELEARLREAKEELFNLRFQAATGQLESHGRLRLVKKDIAQIYTVVRERELGIRTEPTEARIDEPST